MIYKRYKNIYYFTKFKTARAFGNGIRNCTVAVNIANDEQNQLSESIKEFKRKSRPSNPNMKKEKEETINSEKDTSQRKRST